MARTQASLTTKKRGNATNRHTEQSPSEPDDVVKGRKTVRWEGTSEEDAVQSDSEANSRDLLKTCLTAWCQNGRVGCAYYNPTNCTIYVLEDTDETPHFDLTTMLLEQASPDVILTSSRADDAFIDALREFAETSMSIFQIRPHKEFIPSRGRDRLLSLRLLSDLSEEVNNSGFSDADSSVPTNAYDFMKRRKNIGEDPTLKRWNGLIRLSNNFASIDSSPLCIASVGALIDHIIREHAVGDLEDDGISGLEIHAIEALSLDKAMQINADALFSLQIFDSESHASMHSDKTKEGLSLFGILNNTRTSLGCSLLRTWLQRPSLSLPVINARHDAVECFSRPENLVTADVMHRHLQGIRNVPRILAVMKAGRARASDWQGLVKFTFHSAMLRDSLIDLHQASAVEIVKNLLVVLDISSFREVGILINETIDWEESAEAGRVCVRSHIDGELDNRKHVYHGIDSVLSKVAEQVSLTVPITYASSLNVVYFPQLGFLICVPMRDDWRTEAGIQVIDGWTFQFFSESHVYFKSQEMHDMDTHIGDLHSLIVDREIEIVQDLLDKILVFGDAMGRACDVCAELDCLLSFSESSHAYNYRRPRMVDESVIFIKQGRHPLQEQVVATFVPNDTNMGCLNTDGRSELYDETNMPVDGVGGEEEARNGILLCTGANACGKSVYLKQIAMIQFMAQIGCFVPAESATIGVVDKIFTRVSTRESVSKVQSAFMIDLNQVSLALRNCTARSLVLLDEFGKGTVSTDGAGLFCGVIKHLLGRGAACPMVLAATHFHDVFRPGMLDPDALPITLLHMQVLFTTPSGAVLDDAPGTPRTVTPGEKITYLYRVAPGLALASHAAQCAELLGIPARTVQRALHVSKLLAAHSLGQLLDEKMTPEERDDLGAAEAVCRRFLAWDMLTGASEPGDAKRRLAEVLGRQVEEE